MLPLLFVIHKLLMNYSCLYLCSCLIYTKSISQFDCHGGKENNWCLSGVKVNSSHTHKTRFWYLFFWYFLGVPIKIYDDRSRHFYMGVPPPPGFRSLRELVSPAARTGNSVYHLPPNRNCRNSSLNRKCRCFGLNYTGRKIGFTTICSEQM